MALSNNTMLSLRALAILVISLVIVFIVGNMQETFLNPDDDIVVFKNNECRADCCPGELSCSHGCVCLSEEDKTRMMLRGSNRSKSGDTTF